MDDLKILENDLVPVYLTSTGEKVVYGSSLHIVLGVKSNYREWVKRRFSEIDAIENEDFTTVEISTVAGGMPRKDYIIKLDTAKEMAMLERNDRGKQVRRYFIGIEKKYKEEKKESRIEQSAFLLKFIADDMRVNDASRLLMYEGLCKDFNIPTGFLPKYEHNGNREMKAPSHLLKENGCALSALKFNILLIENGYLEEKERPSSNGDTKKYKSLTEKGKEYGENAINPHNQKETQPLYYEDTFMKLYNMVVK